MTVQKGHRLNQMLRRLPPGMLVDSQWLKNQGISSSSIHDYVASGWLEHLQPRLYRRPIEPSKPGPLSWEIAVASAQALAQRPFHVGGPTALDLLGLSHYLSLGAKRQARLYDPEGSVPPWLEKLHLDAEIMLVRRKLFTSETIGVEYRPLDTATGRVGLPVERPSQEGLWRQFLRMSVAERASLEILADVGTNEAFETADAIFEGLANLRPAVLERVLKACTSVKAKRLFFFFADRHRHAWRRGLRSQDFDLGKGKRQVVKGGRLDETYQITVPAGLAPGRGGSE